MTDLKGNFVKADDGTFLNKKWIRFMKREGNCYQICSNSLGCSPENMFKVCKIQNEKEYNKVSEIKTEFMAVDNDHFINTKWLRYYQEVGTGVFKICLKPDGCLKSAITLSECLYPGNFKTLKENL